LIAGNYSNNFQYVPEWLWDRHISPTEFVLYMALRSFSYPTGPTIDMLAAKTGFDSAVVEDTVRSLHAVGLAEPCLADEYGESCNDRWVFTYLKYTKNAADRAPVPPPDDVTIEERQRQYEVLSERRKREYYAAHPGAEEADRCRREEFEAEAALFREGIEQANRNLVDPNYVRSPGPINPDIVGMVDAIKYTYYAAGEQLAEMHYKLGELTGLALLDPDANSGLQTTLYRLWEIIHHGTLSNVLDHDNADDIYLAEFENTYSDGREILTKIRVESEMDSEGAREFNRFILGDGATNDFPRGVIYHINPVKPGDDALADPQARPAPTSFEELTKGWLQSVKGERDDDDTQRSDEDETE
jgi:hypothetical protein